MCSSALLTLEGEHSVYWQKYGQQMSKILLEKGSKSAHLSQIIIEPFCLCDWILIHSLPRRYYCKNFILHMWKLELQRPKVPTVTQELTELQFGSRPSGSRLVRPLCWWCLYIGNFINCSDQVSLCEAELSGCVRDKARNAPEVIMRSGRNLV